MAAQVVARLLDDARQVRRILVMVQREVGERIAAAPGTREAGSLSVKVAFHAEARVVGAVPPTVFFPRPKVDSVLVRLDRRASAPVDVPTPEAMFELARAGFAQRRKMLRRALRPALGNRVDDVLERAEVAPTARAETLTLDRWAALTRA